MYVHTVSRFDLFISSTCNGLIGDEIAILTASQYGFYKIRVLLSIIMKVQGSRTENIAGVSSTQ